MTNREYLATLSDQELSNYIYTFIIPIIGKSYNNTILGFAKWLGQERSVSDYPYWTPSLTIGDDYIETTPKQATWVLSADGFHCNRCGYKEQSSGFHGTCPNCGSKMKGVDDGVLY